MLSLFAHSSNSLATSLDQTSNHHHPHSIAMYYSLHSFLCHPFEPHSVRNILGSSHQIPCNALLDLVQYCRFDRQQNPFPTHHCRRQYHDKHPSVSTDFSFPPREYRTNGQNSAKW